MAAKTSLYRRWSVLLVTGTQRVMRIVSGVHTPTFTRSEAALETGLGLMAWLAAGVSRSYYGAINGMGRLETLFVSSA
jgi:hypothetical protein